MDKHILSPQTYEYLKSDSRFHTKRKHAQLKLKHPDKQKKKINENFNNIENYKPKKKLGFKLRYLKYSVAF